MADGDQTAGGMGMGMILGILLVILVVLVGGYFMFANRGGNPVASAASTAGHTVSGTVKVN